MNNVPLLLPFTDPPLSIHHLFLPSHVSFPDSDPSWFAPFPQISGQLSVFLLPSSFILLSSPSLKIYPVSSHCLPAFSGPIFVLPVIFSFLVFLHHFSFLPWRLSICYLSKWFSQLLTSSCTSSHPIFLLHIFLFTLFVALCSIFLPLPPPLPSSFGFCPQGFVRASHIPLRWLAVFTLISSILCAGPSTANSAAQ